MPIRLQVVSVNVEMEVIYTRGHAAFVCVWANPKEIDLHLVILPVGNVSKNPVFGPCQHSAKISWQMWGILNVETSPFDTMMIPSWFHDSMIDSIISRCFHDFMMIL